MCKLGKAQDFAFGLVKRKILRLSSKAQYLAVFGLSA